MKTTLNYIGILTVLSFIAFSCQKEISFEAGNSNTSSGSLQANGTGGCLGSVVSGTYKKDTTLTAAHYVDVNVQVDTVGSYTITTDTVNGYSFKATGNFTSTGVQVVRLAGSGKPLATGTNVFTVRYDGTICDFSITVTGVPGGGGTGVATFNCATSSASGAYIAGTALAGGNIITISLNVTTVGTWSITTATVNGMTFSGSGTFTTLGAQTITLNGTGTPAAAGTSNIVVTLGTATCTIPITVVPGGGATGVATFNCATSAANGTYVAGTALAGSNTITISANVTTLGTWSITTATMNGMSFSGSGTFTTLGAQTITLNGTGTPATAGTSNFVVTLGTATCTIPVVVTAVPAIDYFPRTANSNWSYELDDVSSDSVLVRATSMTLTVGGNVFTVFEETDDAAAGFDTSGYYRKAGNDYYEWIDMGTAVGLDDEMWMQYIFLKDNQPVGTIWYVPFSGNLSGTPVSARFKYTILQKDITTNANGVPYNNVIVVEERLEQEIAPGNWLDLTTQPGGIALQYKYARNIGLIKIDILDQGTTLSGEFDMRRYAVY